MGSKILTFSSIALFVISLVLLTVGFSCMIIPSIIVVMTYWYKTTSFQNSDIQFYIKYNKEKVVNNEEDYSSTQDWYDQDNRKNEKKTYNIALAFDVLAWIVTILVIGLLLVSLKVSNKLVKFLTIGLSILSLIFIIISFGSFTRLPNALLQDVKDQGFSGCADKDYCSKFLNGKHNGPSVGWSVVVASMLFTFGGIILSTFTLLKY
ncbi:hypothetical protein DFA_02759 [Cavenderia fasciculata]|uniref:Transmembrane protein n=1 Tax=Cavenderia fasciculata TaxID=261658 RepID=F4PI29_CACFS|nr:uncharacterized protein DFA_02759 [Cavenderia fasciculata]EGG24516.1 hypothetical protein DFA_02759 [Cavenderia fasciculata]|eukprot:XP_004362367.1 hypothetical protein DFA_02759 [Cavenderia fasciculata]